MPLPKTMKGCMRKVKKEFPDGRSKEKMSKKAAHKQHVAMCLSATESARDMTFTDFLILEMEQGKLDLDNKNLEGEYLSHGGPSNRQRVDHTVIKQIGPDKWTIVRLTKAGKPIGKPLESDEEGVKNTIANGGLKKIGSEKLGRAPLR